MTGYRLSKGGIVADKFTQSEIILGRVLLILWCQRTILAYIIQLVSKVPVISSFSTYIIPTIIIVSLLLTYRSALLRIKAVDVLFFLLVILVGFLSYLNPDNAPALDEGLGNFLFSVFPFYFCGLIMPAQIGDMQILKKTSFMDLLYYLSMLGVAVAWAYQIYLIITGKGTYNQFTQGAVNVLPSVMFCIYLAFNKKRLLNTTVAIAGCALLIFLGTRAALISALAMICYCLLQKKNWRVRIAAILLLVLYAVFRDTIADYFVRTIAPKLMSSGLSVRVVDMLLGKNMFDSSNRFDIYRKVLSYVTNRPILGYGVFGDRAFFSISGSYSHNIVIEFFVDFGIFFGTAIAVLLLVIYIKALKKSKADACIFGIILSLICSVPVRLLLSQSYLMERDFFLLLGLCIGVLRSGPYNIKEKE